MEYFIGADIGGTKCSVVLAGRTRGEKISIIGKCKYKTEDYNSPYDNIGKIIESIDELIIKNDIKKADIKHMGISSGGPINSETGVIMSPPNLIGWDNIEIVRILEQRTGIRAALQNDANACALAEWSFGAARGYKHVIFLTFGTGMGAGMILNGKLYKGANDFAGEIGHVRMAEHGPVGYGKSGSFEGFCSGGGVAQLGKMKVLEKLQMGEKISFCPGMTELEGLNAKLIGDAAEAGDELASEIYRISGEYLGRGLALLVDLLNPEIIVIGSIFARSESLLRQVAFNVLNRECLRSSLNACKIVTAGLGEQLGDYGALAVALYGHERTGEINGS